MLSRAIVILALLGGAVIALAGCGEGSTTATTETTSGGGANELTFTREDGSTFTISDPEVTCGPSVQTSSDVETIRIGQQEPPTSEPAEPFFALEAVVADVPPGTVVELPTSYPESDPSGATLFAYDTETNNELSSSQGTTGSITFDSVSCDPAAVELTVDAELGSEIGGGSVEVTGSISASE